MERPSYPILKILSNYSRKQGYNIDSEKLRLQLLSNPSYPSLRALTDTLDYFKVENIAAIVPKSSLKELPKMFLAVINLEDQKHIAEVRVSQKGFKLFTDQNKILKITKEKFEKMWDGSVLLIEKTKQAKKAQHSSQKILLVILLLGFMVIGLVPRTHLELSLSALSLVGIFIGYLIIRESLGTGLEVTSKICNSNTTNTSCNEVINSGSSKLFGVFSLSESVLSYFVGVLITLIFLGFNPFFFALLSFLCVPVLVYSLYSQAVIIKKWCPLCLAVATIIFIQCFLVIFNYAKESLKIDFILKAFLIFGVSYLVTTIYKEFQLKINSLKNDKREYLKFKWDYKLFSWLLNQNELNTEPEIGKSHSLTFGNPNSKMVLTGVTNPMCGFCSESFEIYRELITRYENDISLNIVFSVPANDLEQKNTKVAQRLVELYNKDKYKSFDAMVEWYARRDFEGWFSKYGEVQTTDLSILRRHHNWFMANGFVYTPATILNSKLFPKKYDVNDLPLFMDDLLSESSKKEPLIQAAQ